MSFPEAVVNWFREAAFRVKAAWSILRHGHWYED